MIVNNFTTDQLWLLFTTAIIQSVSTTDIAAIDSTHLLAFKTTQIAALSIRPGFQIGGCGHGF